MKYLVATTALATLFATGLAAQETTNDPDALAASTAGLGEGNLLGSQMVGLQVYVAPEGGASARIGSEGTTSADELAGYVIAGQVSDLVVNHDGSLEGIVITLTGARAVPGGQTSNGTSATTTRTPNATVTANEVVIDAGNLQFVVDETVPTLWWVVLDISMAELENAPVIDRRMMAANAGASTGTAGGAAGYGWRGNRAAWTAPTVAQPGYLPVPITEVTAENLAGANVYGVNNEQIGSVSEIVLGRDPSDVSYVVIDVGGFLGIGSREVAIGFDEMTILRTEGWEDLQIHVDATEETIGQMSQYRG